MKGSFLALNIAKDPFVTPAMSVGGRLGDMILRTWSARAAEDGAVRYCDYFENTLLPELRTLPGFVSAVLSTRPLGALVEITAHTTWADLDAIRAFAGDDVTTAKVEPEALAMLADSDPAVVHRTVVVTG